MPIRVTQNSIENTPDCPKNETDDPIYDVDDNVYWPPNWDDNKRAKWRKEHNCPGPEWSDE